jgi:hypothetical protein
MNYHVVDQKCDGRIGSTPAALPLRRCRSSVIQSTGEPPPTHPVPEPGRVVTLFEEDCDALSADLVERLTSFYDHGWDSSPTWHDTKVEDDDDALTLSWKGHSLAFASAWAPAAARF